MLRTTLSPAYCGCRDGCRPGCSTCPCQEAAARTVSCRHGACSCRVCVVCTRGAAVSPGGHRSPAEYRQLIPRTAHRRTTQPSLVVVAFLLLWSLVTSVRAVPVKRSWKDPCNLEEAAAAGGGKAPSDAKLLDQIISVSDVIRPKLDQLMDKFLKLTYPAHDEAEMLRDWGQHNVSWLGFVRETIVLQERQLSALSAAGALPIHFSDLQRLAVGLEQAAVDAALNGNIASMEIFRSLQAGLLQLLCELHLALLEKQLKPDSDKTAEKLAKSSLDVNGNRERDLRNWVIMREYKAYVAHVDRVLRVLRERSKDK